MAITVKIFFYGICTHLVGMEGIPVPHRVIVLNADKVFPHPRLKDIPRHYAWMRLPSGNTPLDGVVLRIDDPSPTVGPNYDEWENRLPKVNLTVRKLDPNVVSNEDALKTAAYFDIDRGAFSLCCHEKAFVTVVTMTDLTAPRLMQRRFRDETETCVATFTEDTSLFIFNASRDATTEDWHHFRLHYVIGGARGMDVSSDPATWCQGTPCGPVHPAPISLGPGCSNSEYP